MISFINYNRAFYGVEPICEVGRVDHDPVWLAGLAGKFCEYPVEHAHPAPANEVVADRLVGGRRPWAHRATSARA